MWTRPALNSIYKFNATASVTGKVSREFGVAFRPALNIALMIADESLS